MFKTVEYTSLEGSYVIVDVRSPLEYKEATIPGAINVPLFDDEERKAIGTVYVQESTEKAKEMGVEAASKKLPQIYKKMLELEKQYGKVVLFCARGGMRSGVLYAFLNALSVNVFRLKGGYKGYRAIVNEELKKLNEEVSYIVLRGNTGVGKTEILKNLEKEGFDILDLEGAANHRGSLLGGVGLGEVVSQKQFESILHHKLKHRRSNTVFIEGESKRIGNILVPDYIHDKMTEGKSIFVDAEIDFRVKFIVEEYMKNENAQEEIKKALYSLNKYIKAERIERYVKLIEEKKYETVAEELMIKYYDPMYGNKHKNYEYDLELKVKDIESACKIVKKWFAENIK